MSQKVKRYEKCESSGQIISTVEGFLVVRFRHVVVVYCRCGHAVVGEVPQRPSMRHRRIIKGWCPHCWAEVPKAKLKAIIQERGFVKGGSL